MSRFAVTALRLNGLCLVQRQHISDSRGFLSRLFCADELKGAGWTQPIAQINHTRTERRGAVRGLHYLRAPHAEDKLVSCVRGTVWDVAVDLRHGSPTFLQWHAQELSAENGCALLIPRGFAHGFQALCDGVELLYCHSAAYVPVADAGLSPLDEKLAIEWPLPIADLSERDRSHARLTDNFEGERL